MQPRLHGDIAKGGATAAAGPPWPGAPTRPGHPPAPPAPANSSRRGTDASAVPTISPLQPPPQTPPPAPASATGGARPDASLTVAEAALRMKRLQKDAAWSPESPWQS